jgi:hemolysin activation/secretion protein
MRYPSICPCLWLALLAGVTGYAPPAARAADPQLGAASPGATESFDILEYRVLHNTVLTRRQIESAVYPHLGPRRTLQDAQAARAQLERAYRDAGYSTVYVDIPEQSVSDGVVRLQVTEGRLGHVRVSGTRYFRNRSILAELPSLQQGKVPLFPDLQADVARLNRATPDLKIAPVLRPGAAPATVDVELKAKDDLPLHGGVEVNNRYTPDTSHTRLVFNLGYANLLQSYQSLSLQYQTAPARTHDTTVLAATYAAPLDSAGDSLSLLAIKTDSDVATVGTLSVLGKGHIYGARLSRPLPAFGSYYSSLTVGSDFKKFDQNVLLTGGAGLQTPIRYINWLVVYGASLAGPKANASFDLDLNFGIRGLENGAAEFENNRYLARPNYTYLRSTLLADRALLWGSRVALRVSTQYTTEPLISNEQFALGGLDSVRGYLEAQALGDMGASGSLELRSATLSSLFGVPFQQAYVYAFGDAGVVELIAPLPQQERRMHLASWGAGVRLGSDGFEAALDWAYPRVSSQQVKIGDSRVDFRVSYSR